MKKSGIFLSVPAFFILVSFSIFSTRKVIQTDCARVLLQELFNKFLNFEFFEKQKSYIFSYFFRILVWHVKEFDTVLVFPVNSFHFSKFFRTLLFYAIYLEQNKPGGNPKLWNNLLAQMVERVTNSDQKFPQFKPRLGPIRIDIKINAFVNLKCNSADLYFKFGKIKCHKEYSNTSPQ